ncbi:uncharacterized protein LOC121728158 [Aricia agestis]|uniref:uncharacterized protein LOC121728158 n=1 Tax=Aricia agestis TaxID=91739 RepID=UPI001C2028AA|nr:uncharacterized protein LOC121728158 [Aricia agestis]
MVPSNLTKNEKPPPNYYHYLVFPLKLVACWEWFEKPDKEYKIIINYVYFSVMLLVQLNILMSLVVHIYLEWTGFMTSLVLMSESLPIIITIFIVAYFATYQHDLYELVEYVNKNFKWHSASGVTNMNMQNSYECAKKFAYFYTGCLTFTVTAYTVIPIVSYLTNNAALPWMYEERAEGNISSYDIYDPTFDDDTCTSIKDCARVYQVIKEFKVMFEKFVSPVLVVRILQYTVYLCVLLYTATVKFDLAMLEYLFAVALDMFFHCYFGNQIIIQSDRVSEAAYQSAWITMGVRPRRLLLNILLSSRRSLIIRAGNYIAIDLQAFIAILKTSFSYYTLLVNVNDKKDNH